MIMQDSVYIANHLQNKILENHIMIVDKIMDYKSQIIKAND